MPSSPRIRRPTSSPLQRVRAAADTARAGVHPRVPVARLTQPVEEPLAQVQGPAWEWAVVALAAGAGTAVPVEEGTAGTRMVTAMGARTTMIAPWTGARSRKGGGSERRNVRGHDTRPSELVRPLYPFWPCLPSVNAPGLSPIYSTDTARMRPVSGGAIGWISVADRTAAGDTQDDSPAPEPAPKAGGEDEDDESGMDPAMAAMMGFGGFGTTKNKGIGEQAIEGTAQVHKQRTWRQYMNRRGGFNRPLDHMK